MSLRRLPMTHSSLRSTTTARTGKNCLPKAIAEKHGKSRALGFEIFTPAGQAGGISSTASDMGPFSGQGAPKTAAKLDGKPILKNGNSETRCIRRSFRASNQLPPICMGFYENLAKTICTGSVTKET